MHNAAFKTQSILLHGNQVAANEIPTESTESSMNSEPMGRVTVSLPRSLLRQFRLHALDQDTTLSALMARLIHQELTEKR